MIRKILKQGSLKLWNVSVDVLRQKHELINLFWECTLRCNFNCKHCGSKAGGSSFSDELNTEEIKKVFSGIAKDFNPRFIFVSITGGEPLLRKDIFEVMGFANKLGFTWGMVSNGYLISDSVINEMKKSGMSSLVISIDGLENIHDSFRNQKGSFKKAIKAVELVSNANFLKELNITTTIHKKNIFQLEEMYNIFKNTGINSWRLTNIDPIGRAMENKDLMLDKEDLTKLLDFIKEKRSTSKIEITYACSGFLGYKYEGEVRNKYFMCITGINVGSILANGDIFVCPNVPRIKKLIQGNVRKDRFSEIWNNKFEFFRNRERTKCEKCYKCENWDNCLGNSMHLWDFDKNEPKMCHLEMIGKD